MHEPEVLSTKSVVLIYSDKVSTVVDSFKCCTANNDYESADQ